MSDRRTDTAEVKALLLQRIESLARELCPDGRRAGRYWLAKCPWRDDRHAGSFWVMVGGGSAGAWRDEATGEKGDVLRLIEKAKGLSFRDTMKWARDWVGLERLDDAAIKQARAYVELRQRDDAAREADLLERNRGRAFAQWLKASDKIAGTPVETYLATRGIGLGRLARPPSALRFAMRRHIETGHTLPAMLALMTGPFLVAPSDAHVLAEPSSAADASGACIRQSSKVPPESIPYAVHCTFLALDGRGKAPVTPVRKMWPSYAGAAIRLARGETGLNPREAEKQGLLDTLCLCEGVEDGLSIALACPELRVWAVGALGNLGKIRIPACSDRVIVAADNDWGKPGAQKQLDAAVAALSAQGRPVSVARSHIGKDANDALNFSAPSAAHQQPARGYGEAAR